jgi:hypothetical protein
MTASFVQTLAIASDPRLAGIRLKPAAESGGVTRAARESRPVAAARPELIGEKTRAAVNAGAIVSFVAGVDEEEKNDVLFSTQLAQRAASAKHDRFAATKAWYSVYVEVLEQLGWVVEGLAFTERGSSKGEFSMDKSALDIIATIAAGGQLAILVKTIDTLKKLGDGDRALQIFDLQAAGELSGNFQMGAVQKADNDALSLALGAFHFTTSDRRGRFLFWKWGAEQIRFWTAVSKLTLNRIIYAAHREAVIAKLIATAPDYVAELDIK